MSDVLFWDASNVAGSGAVWNTGIQQDRIGADGVYRPYIPLLRSRNTGAWDTGLPEPIIGGTDLNRMSDYRVSQFFYDWTMTKGVGNVVGFPDDDTNLKDLLIFVDDFCGKHMLATKEEIKEYEDAAINNKVHSIIKRLLLK